MAKEWLSRTVQLLGDETVERFSSKHVLVVGLGGVGAYAAEMICRAGVGRMTIVDGDTVALSNINRQMPALHSSVGQPKAEILAARFLDINPDLDLEVINEYLDQEAMKQLFETRQIDFVVDAIDTVAPKIELIATAYEARVPIVCAMGAGGKVDPEQIRITDISKTFQCTLAKVIRKGLRDRGILRDIPVVFSPEVVSPDVVIPTNERNKRSTVGTISYLPATFGCFLASYVIRRL